MSKLHMRAIALAIATLAAGRQASAQSGPAHSAKKATHAPTATHRTSKKPTQPKAIPVAKPISVVILPMDSVGGDSIRLIVQRDLDNGDRIAPAFLDPGIVTASAPVGSDSINFAPLRPSAANAVVRIRRSAGGVNVLVYDMATGALRQSAAFPLPVVPDDRSQLLRDSLAHELGARASAATVTLARDSAVRDSLLRAAAVPAKKRQHSKEKAAAKLVLAQRDSLVKEIEARRVVIFADLHRGTVDMDALLPFMLRADYAERERASRNLRTAIHEISDEIQRWLTGTPGIAASRIAYVQGSHLHVVDSDGANDDVVSTPGAALSPAWNPSGKSIVYSDFNDAGTQIGEVDIGTRQARLISATPRGLNITPVFTRDGNSIVYASGGETPADLVITDAQGLSPAKRLDYTSYENTSPSFSPDGTRIVFMSPRPGLTPQLYTMNVDGTRLKQLTPSVARKRSYRTGPDWSPTGEAVAYEQQNGDFQVWMISLKTGKMTRLTSVAENEDPSWAPDGHHMAITSTRGGTREIWVLDVQSARFRQLTHSPGARLSAWSPSLRNDVTVAGGSVAGGK